MELPGKPRCFPSMETMEASIVGIDQN
jgi:hypothetical protein